MKKLVLVMKETYLRQVKSLSFLIMVLMPFFALGLSALSGTLAAGRFNQPDDKGIVSSEPALTQQLSALGYTREEAGDEQAQQALEEGDLSAYLQVDVVDGILLVRYHGIDSLGFSERLELSQILADYQSELNREQAQLSSEQEAVMRQTHILQEVLLENRQWEKLGQQISFFILVFVMYMLLITYSSMTAQDVANEKGTKIMEVIFSSVPATEYFYGKLLGIFGVILTHIGIYVLGGFLSYQFAQPLFDRFGGAELVGQILSTIQPITILFLVLGLFIYVTFSALLGSLVARVEDVQKAISPVMTLIMLGFFGALSLGQSGYDHVLIKLGSFIPFISTFFMPIRVINGYAGQIEAWLSLAILGLTALALVLSIGRAYAGLILQTDDLGLWKSFKRGWSNR